MMLSLQHGGHCARASSEYYWGGGCLTWEFSEVFHYFLKNKNFIHIVEYFTNLFNFSFICYTILKLGDGIFLFFFGRGDFNPPPLKYAL